MVAMPVMSLLRSTSMFAGAVVLGMFCGCAGSCDRRGTLHPEAARVELVTGRPVGCEGLGDVIGSASVERDEQQATQEARSDVRNKAAALGATHVALQTSSGEEQGG